MSPFSARTHASLRVDLSLAARAYMVANKALASLDARVGDGERSKQWRDLAQALMVAEAELQASVVTFDFAWEPMPAVRFLRTHLDELRDTLTYARPAAIGGYGPLDGHARVHLEWLQQQQGQIIARLAQQIECPAAGLQPAIPNHPAPAVARGSLVAAQHRALSGCLQAAQQEYLLLRSYTLAAHAPIAPVFESAYEEAAVMQLLALEDGLADLMITLGAALDIRLDWRAAGAEVLVECTTRAQLSAQRLLHAVSESDGTTARTRRQASALIRAAHKVARLALDL